MVKRICVLLCIALAAFALASCDTRTEQKPIEDVGQPETIPGGGGEVSGGTSSLNSGRTEGYLFTPESTGFWFFESSAEGDGGMSFKIFSPDGDPIVESNGYATEYLEAGNTYSVEVTYYKFTAARSLDYTLRVSLAEAISGSGGEVAVNGMAVYSFTPEHTGSWVFQVSANSSSEPYLLIRDSGRVDSLVAYYKADSGYVSYGENDFSFDNPFLVVHLDAGSPYMIEAGCQYSEAGSFTFTATPPDD